jgi:hypothetical protein
VKINAQEALLKTQTGIPFRIQTNDRVFEFVLTPNDLRSADYKSEFTDKDGRKSIPKDNTVNTFKGKLTDQSGSVVRMFLNGQKIEGFISTQDRQAYFIEPAANYSSKANSDDVVIFQAEDKLNKTVINFGLDAVVAQVKGSVDKQTDARFVKAGFNRFANIAQTTMKSIKVATDADNGFVLANGGVTGSRMKIRSALNTVDGIYERDLNLSIAIGYDHYWKGSDPYGTLTKLTLLQSFKNYWNINYPQTSYSRNVAHLFSDNFTPPGGGGIAYTGALCNNPSFSYSVTYYYSPDASHYASIVAHEIGHNLGGTHTSEDNGYQVPGCEDTIMQHQIFPGVSIFCQYSINEITNYPRSFFDPNQPEGLLCDPTLTSP